ncbi:DNA-protecting protein DprA [Acinetobacter sp. ANC 4910]|uniref:DNA-processing protein DprA n=1 Tax=Acinetobacter sp. ANC 4910 TaxID=2529850 RepID=UPI00103AB2F5|nr:DNA-processing protein DprA [Acinetobacter sp. ANC 4910]TCB31795.1 DNA-protecting protein DprA [Acinetobacter sp. ANC 4910]
MLKPLSQVQMDIITLWYLVQHSLSSFYKLEQHFGTAHNAVQPHNLQDWSKLGLHKNHIQRAQQFYTAPEQNKFQHLIQDIQQHSDFVLSYHDPEYPQQLLPYSDNPPILFGQGQLSLLMQPQIAIVGSRKPSPHGRQIAYDFSYYLSEKGFVISSGLAQGIDQAAHQGALSHQRTLAVMGTGLDQTYPSQHQQLRQQILQQSGAIISEFLPHTPPLQHHFPRRNRIVSALSLGVIVAEASLKSGSIITAKLAAEQGKLVFAIPGHIYSEFHQGCHQLIREGAILVDHPEQVLEDLALPTQWQAQQQSQSDSTTQPVLAKPEIPEHLMSLYNQLNWTGYPLDHLAIHLKQDTASLTAQLMELELLGLCMQQSGVYLRCRPSQ